MLESQSISNIPPFMEELKTWCCQCKCCKKGMKFRNMVMRCFIFGFIIPIFWFFYIILFIYIQTCPVTDIEFPRIDDTDLPTKFEINKNYYRQVFSFDTSTVNILNHVNTHSDHSTESGKEYIDSSFDTAMTLCERELENTNSVENKPSNNKLLPLGYYHSQYIRMIGIQVIDAHLSLKKFYIRWLLRILCSILGYTLIILLIYTIATKSSGGDFHYA